MADETATQPQLSVSHLLNYMLYKKTCRIFVFICVRWADVYSSAGIEVARPGERKSFMHIFLAEDGEIRG